MSHRDLLLFASPTHRLQRGRCFGIHAGELLRHLWVIGQTGAGKSTLLETLFVAQMNAGHGAALLDPHGDLAERVLARVPSFRRNDVIHFDPARMDGRVRLNLVEPVDPASRPIAAAVALSVLRKTFDAGWGPRTEHLLRNAILALLETPRATLMGVLRLFSEDRYREMVLRHVTDPVVRYFWEVEFPGYSPNLRAEATAAPANKIGALLANPLVRPVVDTPRKGLDARRIMDQHKLFVASLAKGVVGEDASALLGALVLGRFQLAAYARADMPPAERAPFTTYADEFQTMLTSSFAELLAEGRKYGLGLVLANQHLEQLEPRLRAALLGNVGTIACFRVGADDAEALAPEFAPELRAHDLARLPRHEFAIKLSVDGTTTSAFTARVKP